VCVVGGGRGRQRCIYTLSVLLWLAHPTMSTCTCGSMLPALAHTLTFPQHRHIYAKHAVSHHTVLLPCVFLLACLPASVFVPPAWP
jgi:hypothetical protein